MEPMGMKTGFKVTSDCVPKVEVHVGNLYLQQSSSLVIMREDFMDVITENVAFQNSLGPRIVSAGAVNLEASQA